MYKAELSLNELASADADGALRLNLILFLYVSGEVTGEKLLSALCNVLYLISGNGLCLRCNGFCVALHADEWIRTKRGLLL